MSHSHSHDHSHGPAPTEHGRAFIITIVLNSAFVLVEFIYGVIAHSTALMADAGHNLSDVLVWCWRVVRLCLRAAHRINAIPTACEAAPYWLR